MPGDFFSEFGGQPEGDLFAELGGEREEAGRPEIPTAEALVSSLIQSLPFADQGRALGMVLQGGSPAIPELQFPDDASFGDKYLQARRALAGRQAEEAEQHPTATKVGTGAGIASQFAASGGVSALRALPGLVKQLPAALRGLISREAAVGAGKAGAAGAGYGLGYSDADVPLVEGDLAGAAAEAGKDAGFGAVVGAPFGGLFGAMAGGQAAKAFDAAAPLAKTNAVQLVGLTGKRNWAGGPESLAKKAEAVFDEVLPDGTKLMTELLRRSPEEGLQFAKRLQAGVGQELGTLRTQLAALPSASRSAAAIKQAIHSQFGSLPSTTRAKALEVVDGMIDRVAKGGWISAGALRPLLEDVGAVAKYGAPGLETALAKQAAPVFTRARSILADTERAMVAQHMPGQLPAYEEALRRYGVFSTASRGALEKFNNVLNGQSAIPSLLEPQQTLMGTLAPATVISPKLSLGRRALQYMAPSWFKAVRPTTAQLVEVSEEAEATLQQFRPILESALRAGPAAVQTAHRMLMQDEDYRDVYRAMEVGRAEGVRHEIRERGRVAPLEFDTFRGQW